MIRIKLQITLKKKIIIILYFHVSINNMSESSFPICINVGMQSASIFFFFFFLIVDCMVCCIDNKKYKNIVNISLKKKKKTGKRESY